MAIITERTAETGRITVNHKLCNQCGICIEICKDFSLVMKDGKVQISDTPLFGCIACGHCVAVCQRDAITLEGREVKASDFLPAIKNETLPGYEALSSLLRHRRSIRDFKDKRVEKGIIEKIIYAASTAPMGLPPSDVHISVLYGKQKVREFSFEFIDTLKKSKFMFSPVAMALMRPFMSKESYDMTRTFVPPLIDIMQKGKNENTNYLLYDAPVAMFFSAWLTDPADPYIAATYAMIAAESLGLGSCMIGSIAPFLKYGNKKLKTKYGIHPKMTQGIAVIFGYPKYKFHHTINRTFASVKWNE
jgi:nitroreductase/ferredoxin